MSSGWRQEKYLSYSIFMTTCVSDWFREMLSARSVVPLQWQNTFGFSFCSTKPFMRRKELTTAALLENHKINLKDIMGTLNYFYKCMHINSMCKNTYANFFVSKKSSERNMVKVTRQKGTWIVVKSLKFDGSELCILCVYFFKLAAHYLWVLMTESLVL